MTPDREPRPRLRRALLPILLGALAATLLTGCDSWFYRPDQVIRMTPASFGLQAEELAFAAPGGPPLHGWWIPAQRDARGTVVYCHGNHANITHHLQWVRWLPARGFNLLIFDYRGYGRSEGEPTREGTVADAVAALDVALRRDPDRTILFGHSLGGAIGLVAATRRPAVRAVAVESTFSSYRDAARCSAPMLGFLVPLLVSAGDDPEDVVAQLAPRPLLVIHGTDDDITPLSLGRALYAKAAEPKSMYVVEGGAHRTPWATQGEAFEERLCAFFAGALRR